MTLESHDLVRSGEKLKTIYPHYQSGCDHQTLQDGNLPSLASTRKVTRAFDHVVLQDHVKN